MLKEPEPAVAAIFHEYLSQPYCQFFSLSQSLWQYYSGFLLADNNDNNCSIGSDNDNNKACSNI